MSGFSNAHNEIAPRQLKDQQRRNFCCSSINRFMKRGLLFVLILCGGLCSTPAEAQDSSKLEKTEQKLNRSERKEQRLRKKMERQEKKLERKRKKLNRQENKVNRRERKHNREQRKLEREQQTQETTTPAPSSFYFRREANNGMLIS
jgi:septal ring factor EnvC (AmiA/AmiB activator)